MIFIHVGARYAVRSAIESSHAAYTLAGVYSWRYVKRGEGVFKW